MAAALAAGTGSVLGASPSVTAVLSNSEVAVGEMAQLEIRVTDAGQGGAAPGDISVDGLEIHQTGTSREFEMHNFNTTSSMTYNYTVLPLKPGTFKIPPQTFHAGNTTLRTPELTLRVSGLPSQPGTPNAAAKPGPGAASNRLAFAEIVVPKNTAYVGEIIPVVIRVAFATRANLTEPPEIAGQGFTMRKIQVPDQPQLENINGRKWEVLTFKTAMAPARPGKLEIGPAETEAIVTVPRRPGSSRNRSPLDIFDLDDSFFDPSSNLWSFGQQQRIKVRASR